MIRLALLLVLLAAPVEAQTRGWTAEKCARYGEAWTQALARFGREGLGTEFLARHDAFLGSGCRERPAVCPRSRQELAMADVMTIAAMNAGMASSFVPFICREPAG